MNEKNIIGTINSFMIALSLTSAFITRMIAAIFEIEQGVTPILSLLAFLGTMTAVIFTNSRIYLEKKSTFFLYYILLFFLISIMIRGIDSYASLYFLEFIFYGLLIYLLSQVEFYPSLVIYYSMILGNIILINPIAFKDYISLGYTYDFVSMDATYAILPCTVATIIYFIFLRKKGNKLLNLISIFSNIYLLYIVLFEGPRGAVLAIILLFVLIVYIYISNKIKVNFGLISLNSFLSAILLFVITAIAVNIQKLLLWLDNLLLSNNIEIAAIRKTLNLIDRSGLLGILNARDWYYEKTIELFTQSPIYGHGIGIFADLYEGRYPHNLFLQLLAEGGIILTIPFIFILGFILWLLIKPWSRTDILFEKRLFILFLFIVCIPRLTFSSYLWRQQALWLLIFFVFTLLSTRKEKTHNINFLKEKDILADKNLSY